MRCAPKQDSVKFATPPRASDLIFHPPLVRWFLVLAHSHSKFQQPFVAKSLALMHTTQRAKFCNFVNLGCAQENIVAVKQQVVLNMLEFGGFLFHEGQKACAHHFVVLICQKGNLFVNAFRPGISIAISQCILALHSLAIWWGIKPG